jgi:hypothetical protein
MIEHIPPFVDLTSLDRGILASILLTAVVNAFPPSNTYRFGSLTLRYLQQNRETARKCTGSQSPEPIDFTVRTPYTEATL